MKKEKIQSPAAEKIHEDFSQSDKIELLKAKDLLELQRMLKYLNVSYQHAATRLNKWLDYDHPDANEIAENRKHVEDLFQHLPAFFLPDPQYLQSRKPAEKPKPKIDTSKTKKGKSNG